jgi:hypothetical protein
MQELMKFFLFVNSNFTLDNKCYKVLSVYFIPATCLKLRHLIVDVTIILIVIFNHFIGINYFFD